MIYYIILFFKDNIVLFFYVVFHYNVLSFVF